MITTIFHGIIIIIISTALLCILFVSSLFFFLLTRVNFVIGLWVVEFARK
jgi:hypothetical protein